jgi:hypothetical protein
MARTWRTALEYQRYRKAERGHRRFVKAGALIITSAICVSGALAAERGCKTSHTLIGRCYVVRGKISAATEIGLYLEISGVKKTLIITTAPGSDPLEMLPNNVLEIWRNEPRPDEILGPMKSVQSRLSLL